MTFFLRKHLKAPIALLVCFVLVLQMLPAPQPAQAGFWDTVKKIISKISLPNEIKLTDEGKVDMGTWGKIGLGFTENPFNNIKLNVGDSRKQLINPSTGLPTIAQPVIPEECELRIKRPGDENDCSTKETNGERQACEEELIAHRAACTQFVRLQRAAAEEVWIAKKIFNSTNPYDECFFLANCRSKCYLSYGELKYTITWLDIAQFLLPTSWITVIKKIMGVMAALNEIKTAYEALKSLLTDGIKLVDNFFATFSYLTNMFAALDNIGGTMSAAIGVAGVIGSGLESAGILDIPGNAMQYGATVGAAAVLTSNKGINSMTDMLKRFSDNLLRYSAAKSETNAYILGIQRDLTAILEGDSATAVNSKGAKHEQELSYFFEPSSEVRKSLDQIVGNFQVSFKQLSTLLDNAVSPGQLPGELVTEMATGTIENYYVKDELGDFVLENGQSKVVAPVLQFGFESEDRSGGIVITNTAFSKNSADFQWIHNEKAFCGADCSGSNCKVCIFDGDRILPWGGVDCPANAGILSPTSQKLYELTDPEYVKAVLEKALNDYNRFDDSYNYAILNDTKLDWLNYWKEIRLNLIGNGPIAQGLPTSNDIQLYILNQRKPNTTSVWNDYADLIEPLSVLDNRSGKGGQWTDKDYKSKEAYGATISYINDYNARVRVVSPLFINTCKKDKVEQTTWLENFQTIFSNALVLQAKFDLIAPRYIKDMLLGDTSIMVCASQPGPCTLDTKQVPAWRVYWENLGRAFLGEAVVAGLIKTKEMKERHEEIVAGVLSKTGGANSLLKYIARIEFGTDFTEIPNALKPYLVPLPNETFKGGAVFKGINGRDKGYTNGYDDDVPPAINNDVGTKVFIERRINEYEIAREAARNAGGNSLSDKYSEAIGIDIGKALDDIVSLNYQKNYLEDSALRRDPTPEKEKRYSGGSNYWQSQLWCDSGSCGTTNSSKFVGTYDPDIARYDWDRRVATMADSAGNLRAVGEALSWGMTPQDPIIIYSIEQVKKGLDNLTEPGKDLLSGEDTKAALDEAIEGAIKMLDCPQYRNAYDNFEECCSSEVTNVAIDQSCCQKPGKCNGAIDITDWYFGTKCDGLARKCMRPTWAFNDPSTWICDVSKKTDCQSGYSSADTDYQYWLDQCDTCLDTTCACDLCPTCGDGNVGQGEECDDGNTSYLDACLPSCKKAACGDGYTWNTAGGTEECDDDNIKNGDGCSSTCKIEANIAKCGNEEVEGTEECDDGNTSYLDACLNSCKKATCGDGYTWNTAGGTEECDDGNKINGDGCSSVCKNEAGATKYTCAMECPTPTSCFTQCKEVTSGFTSGMFSDKQACLASGCGGAPPVSCGNGKVEGAEECDDGNTINSDACLNSCKNATCGDSYRRPGYEECDDGNTKNGDGCSSLCKQEVTATKYTCSLAKCVTSATGPYTGLQACLASGCEGTTPPPAETKYSCNPLKYQCESYWFSVDTRQTCEAGCKDPNRTVTRCRDLSYLNPPNQAPFCACWEKPILHTDQQCLQNAGCWRSMSDCKASEVGSNIKPKTTLFARNIFNTLKQKLMADIKSLFVIPKISAAALKPYCYPNCSAGSSCSESSSVCRSNCLSNVCNVANGPCDKKDQYKKKAACFQVKKEIYQEGHDNYVACKKQEEFLDSLRSGSLKEALKKIADDLKTNVDGLNKSFPVNLLNQKGIVIATTDISKAPFFALQDIWNETSNTQTDVQVAKDYVNKIVRSIAVGRGIVEIKLPSIKAGWNTLESFKTQMELLIDSPTNKNKLPQPIIDYLKTELIGKIDAISIKIKEDIIDKITNGIGEYKDPSNISVRSQICPDNTASLGFLNRIACFEWCGGLAYETCVNAAKKIDIDFQTKKFEQLQKPLSAIENVQDSLFLLTEAKQEINKNSSIQESVDNLKPEIRSEVIRLNTNLINDIEAKGKDLIKGIFSKYAPKDDDSTKIDPKIFIGEGGDEVSFKTFAQSLVGSPLAFLKDQFDNIGDKTIEIKTKLDDANDWLPGFFGGGREDQYQTSISNIWNIKMNKLGVMVSGNDEIRPACAALGILLNGDLATMNKTCDQKSAGGELDTVWLTSHISQETQCDSWLDLGADIANPAEAQKQKTALENLRNCVGVNCIKCPTWFCDGAVDPICKDVSRCEDTDLGRTVCKGSGVALFDVVKFPTQGERVWPPKKLPLGSDGFTQGQQGAKEICIQTQRQMALLNSVATATPEELNLMKLTDTCSELTRQKQLKADCDKYALTKKAIQNDCGLIGNTACNNIRTDMSEICTVASKKFRDDKYCSWPLNNIKDIISQSNKDNTEAMNKLRRLCVESNDIATPLNEVMKVLSVLMGIQSGTAAQGGITSSVKGAQAFYTNAGKFIKMVQGLKEAMGKAYESEMKKSAASSGGLKITPFKCIAAPAESYAGNKKQPLTGAKGGPVCPDVAGLYSQLQAQFSLIRQQLNAIDNAYHKNTDVIIPLPWDKAFIKLGEMYTDKYESIEPMFTRAEELKQSAQFVWALATALNFASENCTCGMSYCKIPFCISGLPLTLAPLKDPYCALVWMLRTPMVNMAERLEKDLNKPLR